MAARSESKAAEAIADLKRQTGSNEIYFLRLDLSDLASIKATVAEFLR
jgi:NADP-dependent 3-hydroxy acid dehydrogenase YdfG